MSAVLGVVDYGSGNLRSVCKALEAAGARVRMVAASGGESGVDGLVVPGVGAFGDCMANLEATGLAGVVRDWAGSGRPYLGICLGYQLLFGSSEESPGVRGLGVLAGRVAKFSGAGGLKVPHMGWNTIGELRGPLYEGISEDTAVYFVHSYYPEPGDPSLAGAWCDYGVRFAASVSQGNLHATQFHPEKSQAAGLAILRNFLKTL